jgi:hypothetical protein
VRYVPINGHPAYFVGTNGRVYKRVAAGRRHFLKPQPVGVGYLRVTLYPGPRRVFVHRLVLEAFVGPRPAGMQCCHGDGDRENNAASNLRWASAKANAADRDQHGTTRRGERHYKAKLTEAVVRLIRADAARGLGASAIARLRGLKRPTVCHVIAGKTWCHVK